MFCLSPCDDLLNNKSDGLALVGNAPRIFAKTNKRGLPYIAISFCALFATLGYMSVSGGAGRVFGWFANMTAVAGLLTWFGIVVTYIQFHRGLKAQGIDRTTLPFYTRVQPFAAWYALVVISVVCIVSFIFLFFVSLQKREFGMRCADDVVLDQWMGGLPPGSLGN